jgi:hypothetical protein
MQWKAGPGGAGGRSLPPKTKSGIAAPSPWSEVAFRREYAGESGSESLIVALIVPKAAAACANPGPQNPRQPGQPLSGFVSDWV